MVPDQGQEVAVTAATIREWIPLGVRGLSEGLAEKQSSSLGRPSRLSSLGFEGGA